MTTKPNRQVATAAAPAQMQRHGLLAGPIIPTMLCLALPTIVVLIVRWSRVVRLWPEPD